MILAKATNPHGPGLPKGQLVQSRLPRGTSVCWHLNNLGVGGLDLRDG